MRTINLTNGQAWLLLQNLGGRNYSYPELVRMDKLATKILESLGEYGSRFTEMAVIERRASREIQRGAAPAKVAEANRALADLQDEADEMREGPGQEPLVLQVENADWQLIADRLDSVEAWTAIEALRKDIIGMVEAVKGAESDEPAEAEAGKVKRLRRR